MIKETYSYYIWWECAFSSFVAIDTNAEMFKQRFFFSCQLQIKQRVHNPGSLCHATRCSSVTGCFSGK